MPSDLPNISCPQQCSIYNDWIEANPAIGFGSPYCTFRSMVHPVEKHLKRQMRSIFRTVIEFWLRNASRNDFVTPG
jgi:hypothetical protein